MDDDELAARRRQIPVHCAACGGEFPGTTVLHNGICDECHKLTHGPNYRLVAEVQRVREVAEKNLELFARERGKTMRLEREVETLRLRIERCHELIRGEVRRCLSHHSAHYPCSSDALRDEVAGPEFSQ